MSLLELAKPGAEVAQHCLAGRCVELCGAATRCRRRPRHSSCGSDNAGARQSCRPLLCQAPGVRSILSPLCRDCRGPGSGGRSGLAFQPVELGAPGGSGACSLGSLCSGRTRADFACLSGCERPASCGREEEARAEKRVAPSANGLQARGVARRLKKTGCAPRLNTPEREPSSQRLG